MEIIAPNTRTGMKKKLALAVAALLPSELRLPSTEPFEGVDAGTSRTIRDLLRRRLLPFTRIDRASSLPYILELVEKLCTHVGIVVHGKLVVQSSMTEIRQSDAVSSNTASGRGRGLLWRHRNSRLAGGSTTIHVKPPAISRPSSWLRWRLFINGVERKSYR